MADGNWQMTSSRCGAAAINWLIGAAILAAIAMALVAVFNEDKNGTGSSGLSPDFKYDLKDLKKTDPSQVLYREAAPIVTGLAHPSALCIGPQDKIFVAGGKTLHLFDTGGKPLAEITLKAQPTCLAVSADGLIYAGMRDHIEVIVAQASSPQPGATAWPGLGERAHLTSLALVPGGLFAADAGNRVVIHYDNAGKELGRLDRKAVAPDGYGFIIPSPYFDIAVGPDGLLHAANTGLYRIEAYKISGEYVSAWGKMGMDAAGFCGCCNPAHFTILPDGGFVTAEKGLCRVKVYGQEGKFLGFVAGAELFQKQTDELVVAGLAADSQGRVLLLDPANGNVRVFEKKK
jgi:hypothetical protein